MIAVAHSQLPAIYEMLKNSTEYHDLGANYLDELQRDRIKKHLVRRLTGMGFEVKLTETPPQKAA